MSKFKIKSKKKNNSHPFVKIAIREWLIKNFKTINVIDVYGGNGLMYKNVWKLKANEYNYSEGDAIKWLCDKTIIRENIFDVDPYASPFEAVEIICKKAKQKKIGLSCTDGSLRRSALMRTKISKYLINKCDWPERSLSLLAGIYHKYPSYLRYVFLKIAPKWDIEKLVVKYGVGTWKQATVYFSVILVKKNNC